MKTILSLILVAFLFGNWPSYAQSGRPQPVTDSKANQRRPQPSPTPAAITVTPSDAAGIDDGDIIKINTQLVSVPVRVMDKKGRFIGGLAKENFKVFEDGNEQEIALFSNEHQAFTVALLLDMSYSSTFKIAEIQNAAIQFIDQLRPQDKITVISFDEEVHVLCEPTNDRQEIYRAIRSTRIATGTSLYEAVDTVINRLLRPVEGRKAIILFTDGVDTTSRKSNDYRNLNDAMELDSLIYSIRYDTFADVQAMKRGAPGSPGSPTAPPPIRSPLPDPNNPFPFPMPSVGSPSSQGTTEEEYRKAEAYLTRLAENTGGRIYQASTLTNLADAYSRIASELREFYSIAYYPKNDRTEGQRTSVKVKVDQPGLVVRAREGYLSRRSK